MSVPENNLDHHGMPPGTCYAERVEQAEILFPCLYGHPDCAMRNQGACVAEHRCIECAK